jgi:hypothetical protein
MALAVHLLEYNRYYQLLNMGTEGFFAPFSG